MSTTADRYRRLAAAMAATIRAVPADAWGARTPCEDWTARELVRHLVDSQGLFLGLVGRSLGDGPSVEDDPAAAWDHARSVVQHDLDDPERAAATFEGVLGTTTFESGVGRFLCTDLVIHRWDLATATGQGAWLDPGDMGEVRAQMEPLGDMLRGPGAFGPILEPPPGADEQAAFLAYFGRAG